jgi:hypothetical protein
VTVDFNEGFQLHVIVNELAELTFLEKHPGIRNRPCRNVTFPAMLPVFTVSVSGDPYIKGALEVIEKLTVPPIAKLITTLTAA